MTTPMDQLYKALAAAIAQMADPKRNAKNDHFKNRYADLGAVLECIEGPLAENKLLLVQLPLKGEACHVLLTRLVHLPSGQQLEFEFPLLLDKPTAQSLGSSITYARRYTIKSLFGMVDTDDDGNAASGVAAKPQAKAAPAPKHQAVDVGPFDNIEDAIAHAAAIKDKAGFDEWSLRVRASKFTGADKDQAVDMWKELTARLK